jgi:hypothetical protein
MKRILIGFCLIVLLAWTVSAANGTIVETVHQGDTIYWHDIADLSQAASWPAFTVAWWQQGLDGSGGLQPDKVVDVSSFMRRIEITPDKFPVGTWYRWDGQWRRGENMVAFFVQAQRPFINLTPILEVCNISSVNYSAINCTNTTPPEIVTRKLNLTEEERIVYEYHTATKYPLPQKHIADYLMPRGYPLSIDVPTPGEIWVVSTSQNIGIYDRESINGVATLNISDTENLEPGGYIILGVDPNGNKIYTFSYDPDRKVLYSPFADVKNISTDGMLPFAIIEVITGARGPYCDDVFTYYNLTIDKQSTTTVEEIETLEDFSNKSPKFTRVRLAGYTSLPKGETLTIILDKSSQDYHTLPSVTWNTTVFGDELGDLRQFEMVASVDLSLLKPGKDHSFSVITPDGSEVMASFPVSDISAEQTAPKAYIRIIDGKPFHPTPTPEIRIVKEIVTQKVVEYVQVTPAPTPTPVPLPFFFVWPWSMVIGALIPVVLGWILWKYVL